MNNANYAKTRRAVMPVYLFLFGMVVAFNLSKIADGQSINPVHPQPKINIEPAAPQRPPINIEPAARRPITTIVVDWLGRVFIFPGQTRTAGD